MRTASWVAFFCCVLAHRMFTVLGFFLSFSVKYGEVAPQAPKIEHLPHKVQSTEFCQGLRQQDTLWGGNISISGDVGFQECFGV